MRVREAGVASQLPTISWGKQLIQYSIGGRYELYWI